MSVAKYKIITLKQATHYLPHQLIKIVSCNKPGLTKFSYKNKKQPADEVAFCLSYILSNN